MASQLDLKIANLLLDLENPRLPAGQKSQLDTLHAMLRAEGASTLALAESIGKEGLSPTERWIVIPSANEAKRHVVLEGNRRLTALRILSEPSLAEGFFSEAKLKKLRKLSADYINRGVIKDAACALFQTRDEANPWIERRHRGSKGGVGIVAWGATESARFDARSSGKKAPELQILDFVAERSDLDAATRDKLHDVSITNLRRLVRDKDVRKRLGITLVSDVVQTKLPEDEVLKGLTRIIKDLAHDKLKVADIYTASKRAKYLGKFKPSELPSPSKAQKTLRVLSAAEGLQPANQPPSSSTPTPRSRAMLIPKTCKCHVKGARLRNIYAELRRLRLETFPNAVSVLLRVFLELSVDEYIEKNQVMPPLQASNSKLRDKLTKAADALEADGKLTHGQTKAAKKVATDAHIVAGTVTTLHQYVHNKEFSASPSDLRASWDNIQPFLEAVWPQKP